MIPAPPAGVDITAYRDHCVWREGPVWRQLVGSGIRGRGGTAFLYESADLRRWEYIGPLFIGDAASGDPAATDWQGTMWECVDLFRAGDGTLGAGPLRRSGRAGGGTDVLVFSAWHDGDTRHPLYWTGRYAGDSFTPRELHRLDYGGRYFYAPQSFADDSGRRVMFGWLQEGRTEAAMVEAGWSGVMSLPRVATLDADGELAFAPVPEVESLRRDHVRIGPRTVGVSEVLSGVSGNQLDLELDLELEPGSVFRLGILGTATDHGRSRCHRLLRPRKQSSRSGTTSAAAGSRSPMCSWTVRAAAWTGPWMPRRNPARCGCPAASCTCASWWTARRWRSSPTGNR